MIDNSAITTARIRVPEPRTVCMSGTSVGMASLALWFATSHFPPVQEGEVVEELDLESLGVASVSFGIDSPPRSGMLVGFSSYPPAPWPSGAGIYPPARFTLSSCGASSCGAPRAIIVSEDVTASITEFLPSEPAHSITEGVAALAFQIGPVESYDFCVRDLTFSDAAGHAVSAK